MNYMINIILNMIYIGVVN